MPSKAIKDEAERLVREHGTEAYRVAGEAVLAARRARNVRMERFRTDVALEVSRREKRLQGQGTAKKPGSSATSEGA